MKIKLLILILISLPLYSFINDRPLNQYVIKNWTRNEGLPQNSVLTNKLVRDGYIWIGTEEGLVRFDGSNFKVFDKYKLKTSHHHIWDIQEDPKKPILWVATSNNGLLAFNYINFSVKKFNISNKYPFRYVNKIQFSSANILWLATSNKGICKFNTETTKVERCYDKKDGLKNNKITSFVILKDGNPIILTGQDNILKFDGKNFNEIKYDLPENTTISNISLDRKHDIWITSYDKGIFRIKDGTATQVMPEVFTGISTDSIYEDKSGTYWVVSKERGIYRLSKDFKSFDFLKLKMSTKIREDDFGNLWVSTLGSGLYRLSPGAIRSYTKKDGVIGTPVYPIFQRSNGNILLGSFGSGVLEFKNDKISQYKTKNGKTITRSVTSIIETKSKDLWFFLYGNGLVNIKNDDEVKTFSTKDGLPGNTGMALLEDHEKNIWGATSKGALFKIDSKDNIKVFFSPNDKVDLHNIASITEDSKGNKWIATSKGVVIFDGVNFFNFKPKIIFNRILSIYHHKDMVVMAGYQGIFILKDQKIYSINHDKGLVTTTILAALIDDYNRLWFTSNNGVFSIDSDELESFISLGKKPKIRSYSIEDGLSSIECAGGSQFNIIKDNLGQIWFPTINGVSVVDPKVLLLPVQKPFIKFDSISFDDKKYSLKDKKVVEINPEARWITIPIISLTHHLSKNIKYRYRLKNYDEKWFPLENNRVRINSLPAGKYYLEVSATDSKGDWLEPITLKLRFTPSLHEKPIFYIVLIPFIILLILFYIKLRTKRIVLKNQELEDLIAERTEKIKELSLSDPLTVLRNRRFVDEIIKPKLSQFFNQKEYELVNDDNRNSLIKELGYAIFLLDIDHFKYVNDKYGHDAGDRVLFQLANLLKDSVRQDDFVVRWGGEEFLIILSNTKSESLDAFARKLKEKIQENPFIINSQGKKIFKTVSAGYLYLPFIPEIPSYLTLEDGVKLADEGLYYAKEHGRNQFIGFKFGEIIPKKEELPSLLKDIDKSIDKKFFEITIVK